MGQATVDLPDPLDAPPPSGTAGTDDLLAQLAGDEIDRLLAEADVERAPAPPAPQPAPTASEQPSTDVGPAPAAAPGDELDAMLNRLSAADDAADVKEQAPAADAAKASAEFADFSGTVRTLTDRVPDVLAKHAPPLPAAAPFDRIEAPTPAPAVAPPGPSADAVMSKAERDALALSDLAEETDAAERDDAAAAAAAAATNAARVAPPASAPAKVVAPPSRLAAPAIRVLEWMNVPLAFVPDRLRDPLGKVAVITIVNSVAVLIYVLFLRH